MKSKYNAKKVVCPIYGNFDSQGEYAHFLFLQQMVMAGEIIGDVKRQVSYPIVIAGKKVCRIIPDYEYTLKDGTLITSDYKGVMTPVAILKFKLFEALYGRKIVVVKSVRQWHN